MIRSFIKSNVSAIFVLSLTLFLAFAPVMRVRAADHGDAPATGNDLAADINDVYLFLDPNDNSRVNILFTFHGFIAPGENSNFGVFDPALRYRFNLENTGDANPDAFIDVTFTRRTTNAAGQLATVRFTNILNNLVVSNITTTNPSATATVAPAQIITNLSSPTMQPPPTAGPNDVLFFAGLTDDPFFFDIPAFGRFTASVRAGTPNPAVFQRGRDSFAGYNTLAIAFNLPVAAIRGSGGNQLGVFCATQRRSPEYLNTRNGQIVSFGRWVNIDRMGNPAVNVVLVPFNSKDEFNASNPTDDVNGRFLGGIVSTLQVFGTDSTSINILGQVAQFRGEILRLDLTVANAGNGGGTTVGAGFPNGRRPQDDVVDILNFLVNNRNPLPDNVNGNDLTFQNAFPYLAPSQQPRANGVIDDNTRN